MNLKQIKEGLLYLDVRSYISLITNKINRLDVENPQETLKCVQALKALNSKISLEMLPIAKSYDQIIQDYSHEVGYVFILGSKIESVS